MIGKLTDAIKRLLGFRYRNSMTGRYVTRRYAEKHPDTTERERVK